MNTLTVSATHARNNFFELLELVVSGQSVVIKRDTKEVAEIIPRKKTMDWKGLLQASRETHGIWKGHKTDSPLHKKGAWPTLGNWDRKIVRTK